MPMPRPTAARDPKPRGKRSASTAPPASRAAGVLRPDLSRRGMFRMAGRATGVCAMIGFMTIVAGLHATGKVRRGEIQRMVQVSEGTPTPASESKNRGRLDKGRLGALAASAAR